MVKSRTQTGRRRFVAIKKTLAAKVMEVSMSREAGTFFAVGATACALRVAPTGAKWQFFHLGFHFTDLISENKIMDGKKFENRKGHKANLKPIHQINPVQPV